VLLSCIAFKCSVKCVSKVCIETTHIANKKPGIVSENLPPISGSGLNPIVKNDASSVAVNNEFKQSALKQST
jgi:hypothetical protein